MFTDTPPRKNRTEFLESDRIKALDLPRNGTLTEIAQRLESAMKFDNIRDVRSACAEFLASASDFYEVPTCTVQVLAADPYEPVSVGHSNSLATTSQTRC